MGKAKWLTPPIQMILQNAFHDDCKPNHEKISKISQETGIDVMLIRKWFYSHRRFARDNIRIFKNTITKTPNKAQIKDLAETIKISETMVKMLFNDDVRPRNKREKKKDKMPICPKLELGVVHHRGQLYEPPEHLRNTFKFDANPSIDTIQELAIRTGLDPREVQDWFTRQRCEAEKILFACVETKSPELRLSDLKVIANNLGTSFDVVSNMIRQWKEGKMFGERQAQQPQQPQQPQQQPLQLQHQQQQHQQQEQQKLRHLQLPHYHHDQNLLPHHQLGQYHQQQQQQEQPLEHLQLPQHLNLQPLPQHSQVQQPKHHLDQQPLPEHQVYLHSLPQNQIYQQPLQHLPLHHHPNPPLANGYYDQYQYSFFNYNQFPPNIWMPDHEVARDGNAPFQE